MHDKKNHEKLKNFLRGRGHYVLALICALAVGVSGYLYFSRPGEGEVQLSSSTVPQIVDEPTDDESTPPAQRNAEKHVDAAALLPDAVEEETVPTAFTIQMPVEGDLIQLYSMENLSYNPTTRDWRTHDGIDICSGVGAEVRAAADGTVASILEDDELGTVVTIRHAGGFMTRYANLDPQTKVTVGQTVRQGDPVGAVGTTALMESGSDNHLHFELSRDAVSLNPTDYFAW